jgi:toxin ParE1/3/4
MPRYVIAAAAQRDIESILAWTDEQFGGEARRRYQSLLLQAIRDVAAKPDRAGVTTHHDIAPNARTYALRHSRDRVQPSQAKVRRPRHFLLFRMCADGSLEISRVLHEHMDLSRHLPEAFDVAPDDLAGDDS